MKKLNEMKIAKDVILSPIEAAIKGGSPSFGDGTTYHGPLYPSSITTLLDGHCWGEDGYDGWLFGDSWHLDRPMEKPEGIGRFDIHKIPY